MPKSKPKHRERAKTPPVGAAGDADAAAADVKTAPAGGAAKAKAAASGESITRRDVYFTLLSSSMAGVVHLPKELIRIVFAYSQSSNDLNVIIVNTPPPPLSTPAAACHPRVSVWSGDVFDGYMDAAYREVIYSGLGKAAATGDMELEFVRFSNRSHRPTEATCQVALDSNFNRAAAQRFGARDCAVASRRYPGHFLLAYNDSLLHFRPLASDEKRRRYDDALAKQTELAIAAAATATASAAAGAATAAADAAAAVPPPAPPALVRAVSVPPPAPEHYTLVRESPCRVAYTQMCVTNDIRTTGPEYVVMAASNGAFEFCDVDTLTPRLVCSMSTAPNPLSVRQALVPLRDGRVFIGGLGCLVCINTRELDAVPRVKPGSTQYQRPTDALSKESNRCFSHLAMLDDGYTLCGATVPDIENVDGFRSLRQYLCTFDVRRKKVEVENEDGGSATVWQELTDTKSFEMKDGTYYGMHRAQHMLALAGMRIALQNDTDPIIHIFDMKTGESPCTLQGRSSSQIRPLVLQKGNMLVAVTTIDYKKQVFEQSVQLSYDSIIVWDVTRDRFGFCKPDPIATIDDAASASGSRRIQQLCALPLNRFAVATDTPEGHIKIYSSETFQCEMVLTDPNAVSPPIPREPSSYWEWRYHYRHPRETVISLLTAVES